MKLTIEDPRGFPDTLADDLDRAEFDRAGDCDITYTEDAGTVRVAAADSVAAKQLYDWLEETRQYYKREYVSAGEHDAARQLADAVYNEIAK